MLVEALSLGWLATLATDSMLGCADSTSRKGGEAESPYPLLTLEELKALSPDETTAYAKQAGVLNTTYMYDYAPYAGARGALVPTDQTGEATVTPRSLDSYTKATTSVCPTVVASSAFYPATAAILEAHYGQAAYEAAEQGLEPIATYTAFSELAAGKPLVVVASAPNDDQQEELRESGRDIRCEPVAREALVFYVRDDGREEDEYPSLTSDEICDAFMREDSPWQAFALEHGNGSTMCYEEFAQGSSERLDVSEKTLLYPDMVSIIAGAALTNRSIGFAFHQFYQHNCSSPAMAFSEVDGVYPSWDNIRTGVYPVMFDMCVLYDAEGVYAEDAEELVAWLRSDEGQQLVFDLGMCPFAAAADAAGFDDGAAEER